MNTSGRLLLASILAVVLMAPPASSQTKEQVNDMLRDLIDIKGAVGALQRNADARNAEMKGLLEQILGRFTAIDASVQKLESSLSAIKTNDEKSARDLADAKTTLAQIQRGIETLNKLELGETLTELKGQVGGLNKQITALQNTEAPLPDSREAFFAAVAELNQGIYDLAISDFRDFLSTYPKDPRAPTAQLMIGNAYSALKKFDQALIEYELTIEKYPNLETKCTALYKKGQTLAELNKAAPAKAAYEQVVKECANTPEHALAQQALKPAGRGGRGN